MLEVTACQRIKSKNKYSMNFGPTSIIVRLKPSEYKWLLIAPKMQRDFLRFRLLLRQTADNKRWLTKLNHIYWHDVTMLQSRLHSRLKIQQRNFNTICSYFKNCWFWLFGWSVSAFPWTVRCDILDEGLKNKKNCPRSGERLRIGCQIIEVFFSERSSWKRRAP